MITNKTSNVTKKHSCSIPCADSTVSGTTTSSATASDNDTTGNEFIISTSTTQAPSGTNQQQQHKWSNYHCSCCYNNNIICNSERRVHMCTCIRLSSIKAHTLSYVVGDDCANSNDTYCEYDTHEIC